MNDRVESTKKMIEECSVEERQVLKAHLRALAPHRLEEPWGLDADTILGAIDRSSDLTKRGVRGIIAEAVFETSVGPLLKGPGWKLEMVSGDVPYDALLKNLDKVVKVQVKLQRSEKGMAKHFYPAHYVVGSLFVVEVQKTRSGETKVDVPLQGTNSTLKTVVSTTQKTRPYKFGDFDILAVNMHPSSGDWKNFRYTVASWLLQRPTEQNLLEVLQPVAAIPNDVWTTDILTCLHWLESGEMRSVLATTLHARSRKAKSPARKRGRSKK